MNTATRAPVLAYALTIFLSAFLLFQVQPLMGKMILPWFGGSASVWTTCMLFFQSLLLLGYLYTHWLVRHLTPTRQSALHVVLLLVCLWLLPITPSEAWKPDGAENPTLRILGLLTASIGLPYFVLSTTGPLVQAWFAREQTGLVPYRLFALSNLGSMLALLAYPLAVEPLLPTRAQSWAWSGLFLCFVAACAYLAWRGRGHGVPARSDQSAGTDAGTTPGGASVSWGQRGLWVALAACPSILMVADTSFLTENIAPIPMLWVAPLALYLLSFILCFEGQGWYRRTLWLPLFVVALGLLAYLPTLGIGEWPIATTVGLNLCAFFVVCMVCHGELAKQQPASQHLTMYYLMLSVGGFLGGFFVGVVAPYGFDSNYELSVGLVLSAVVVMAVLLGRYGQWPKIGRGPLWVVGLALVLGLGVVRVQDHQEDNQGVAWMARNFYGALKVYEVTDGGYLSMLHGQIIHGQQFTDEQRRRNPTSYYTPSAGAGMALLAKAAQGPLKVGVVGVGVGTLVTYGRAGDEYRLYDIDPLVIQMAQQKFTYLRDTAARTEVVLGDARLQLERESAQGYDVLVVDAFSGDSVPIHLLTREAFALYFKHLKPDGVLAVHITNRFLDLLPVLQTAATHFGKTARLVEHDGDRSELSFSSRWVLVSGDATFFDQPALQAAQAIEPRAGFVPWRDDYSSLLSVLKN